MSKLLNLVTMRYSFYSNFKKSLFFLFLFVFAVTLSNCKGGEENNDELTGDTVTVVNIQKEILFSMPAPSDIALILIDAPDLKFQEEILNSPENADKYISNLSIALNLGIYTADLSYASYFEQSQLSLNYLIVSKKLAEKLGITNAIEEKHLELLSNAKIDKRAMITIVNEVFMNTDSYLLENNRKDIMSMILVGGWVEAQYIATRLTNDSPTKNTELTQRIIDQQSVVQLMALMFENVPEDAELGVLKSDVKQIREAYIKFNSGVTDQNFKEFCDLVKTLRDKYTS